MTKTTEKRFAINWERAVFIDQPLTEQFVRQLTPDILRLRSQSSDPITVAIDSPGGSLAVLDTLLGLLTGPQQECGSVSIVTVTTNRAYSAAANLLAFGDYAVALGHSEILFHDVRFGELADVTPSKARDVAKSLQDTNDRFALRLANRIIKRLVWCYLGLKPKFEEDTKNFPRTLKKFRGAIGDLANPLAEQPFIDIASFATSVFAKLSKSNDTLINNVMERLGKWVILTRLAEAFPIYRVKGSRRPGLLDGARAMYNDLCKASKNEKEFSSVENELQLLVTLLVAEVSQKSTANKSFFGNLDEATRNFNLIQSMNEQRHIRSAVKLMLDHEWMFFGKSLNGISESEKDKAIRSAMPYAQLFWLFCVSLCRELFEGEHSLTPKEGQLLGLLDEVAGGGYIKSKREFGLEHKAKSTSAASAPKRKSAKISPVVKSSP